MCKKFLFIALLACSNFAFCNDWDLFQYHQKSYYKPNKAGYLSASLIYCAFADSVFSNGNTRYTCFLRKEYQNGVPACYDSLISNYGMSYYDSEPFSNNDTLSYRNDSLFLTSETGFTSIRNYFLFLPKAYLNQSWTIQNQSGTSTYHLQVRCSGIQLQSFLGITDSVKTFSFHLFNGATQLASDWDTMHVVLSKNYGLIQAISEYNLLNQASSGGYINYLLLVGVHRGLTQTGFTPPSASDFFHFTVGDVYLWRNQSISFFGNWCTYRSYSRDSITQVINNQDSLTIVYDAIQKWNDSTIHYVNNLSKTYYWSTLQLVSEVYPNWFTTTAYDSAGFDWGFASNGRTIAYSGNYKLDTIQNIPSVTFDGMYTGDVLHLSSCSVTQIPDASYSYSFNTLLGLTSSCYTSFGGDCNQLIAYSGNGIQWGNIDYILGMNETLLPASLRFSISPNPASTKLTVELFKLNESVDFSISDLLGRQKLSGKLEARNASINVSELENGVYTFRVKNETSSILKKFMVIR